MWVTRAISGAPGELLAVDATTLAVAKTIPMGQAPFGVVAEGGLIYVLCRDSRELKIVDPALGTVKQTVDLTPFMPAITMRRGLAVTASGDIYVESDGVISVLVKM